MPTKQFQPQLPRYTVEQIENGVRITLPSRKSGWKLLWFGFMVAYSIFVSIFPAVLIIWLGTMWFRSAIPEARGSSMFVILMLFIVLTFLFAISFALVALYQFLWQLVGKEIIEAGPHGITATKQVFNWRQIREYASDSISDLRASALPARFVFPTHRLVKHDGVIGLDYGAKTFRFGLDIDEAEAKMIIAALKPYLPNLNEI